MQTCRSDRVPHALCALIMRCAVQVACGIVAIVAIAGCGGIVRSYPGVSRDALWAAAVGTAERPTSYDDWHVVENGVYTDKASGRIEIYRELKRDFTLEADRFFDEVGLRLAQASPQGVRGGTAGDAAPARGVPEAGAEALRVPESREAVRGGGAPAAGGPPRESPEPGARVPAVTPAPTPADPAGSSQPPVKTVPERPQD